MQANSPQAVAAGIKIPYANFTNPAIQTTRSVAQALRPFPQYGTINTTNSGGDKTGRSMYHAGVVEVDAAAVGRVPVPGQLHVLEADDQRRRVQRQHRLDGHGAARAGVFDRPSGSDRTRIKLNTVFELPFGPGRRWLNSGVASHVLGGWRMAAVQSYSSGLPIGVTTGAAPLGDFQRLESSERHRRGLARADRRRRVRSAGRSVPQSRGVLGARRAVGQCAAHQRRRAAAVEHVGEHEPREDHLDERVSCGSTCVWRRSTSSIASSGAIPRTGTDFNSTNFGLINTTANSPRQMQIGLKLYW